MLVKNRFLNSLLGMIISISFLLSGCSSMSQGTKVSYHPDDYIASDQIAHYENAKEAKDKQIEQELEKITKSHHAVLTSYGFSNNPKIKEAFKNYKDGKEDVVVHSPGFITYPYDPYNETTVECAPLKVCTIQLQKGELINSIQLGDTARWAVTNFLTGPNAQEGSTSLAIKPTVLTEGISTDLIISTDKRVYQINLVSNPNAKTHVVNFYYPDDTINQINRSAVKRYLNSNNEGQLGRNNQSNLNTSTVVDAKDINTHYKLSGDQPVWIPEEVFDDGVHTFIKMPKIADRLSLPVVWVLTANGDKEPLNARYKHPYFILDGLYQKIYLISGVNEKKVQVVINNENIKPE